MARPMPRILAPIVALAAALVTPVAPTAAQEVELFDYVVREGDSCASIARQRFGNGRRYDVIHRHNPDLGPTPHRLVPGTVLRLPRGETDGPDARVTHVVHSVEARPPAAAWQRAQRGLGLYRDWRVSTQSSSAAEITFVDSSRIHMRENTLVIIYGGAAGSARRRTTEAELERGTLRSRLGELRLQVTTPNARAELDGASVVGVDEDGNSLVSTHEGGAALTDREGRGRQRVAAGFGSKVAPGARPSRPRPLPPAPAWASGTPTRFAGLVSTGGAVHGRWEPVEQARRYRVEILSGDSVVAAAEVPSSVTELEIHRLAPGQYQARVASIDAERFESRPSEPLTMTVEALTLLAPGQREPDATFDPGDPSEAPGPLSLLVGAELRSAGGLRCAPEGRSPAATWVFDAPFEGGLACVDAAGAALPPLPVRVVAPTVEVTGRLLRGRAATVELAIRSDLPLPDGLSLRAPPSVRVGALTSGPSGLTAELTAGPGTPDRVPVELVAERGGGLAVLAELELDVAEDATQTEPAPVPPEEEEEDRWLGGHEAAALLGAPTLLGLRARHGRRTDRATVEGHAAAGVTRQGGDERWRAAAGAELTGRGFRFGVALDADFAGDSDRVGDGGVGVWAGYRLLDLPALAFSADLQVYAPLRDQGAGVDRVHLAPSVDLSFFARDQLVLRTRQGVVSDVDERLYWSSAYGLDFRLVGPLAFGIETDLVAGRDAGSSLVGAAVGVGLSVGTRPVHASLSGRYVLGDELAAVTGRFAVVGSVRVRLTPGR